MRDCTRRLFLGKAGVAEHLNRQHGSQMRAKGRCTVQAAILPKCSVLLFLRVPNFLLHLSRLCSSTQTSRSHLPASRTSSNLGATLQPAGPTYCLCNLAAEVP